MRKLSRFCLWLGVILTLSFSLTGCNGTDKKRVEAPLISDLVSEEKDENAVQEQNDYEEEGENIESIETGSEEDERNIEEEVIDNAGEAENDVVEESVQEDYLTDVSSFVLEGKWKSVGSYGIGQAQPGAVVIFDGVNCNLVSPADTYAFYNENGRWILDCTTAIFADTISFSVGIKDENHIDLSSGGEVTELKRVN